MVYSDGGFRLKYGETDGNYLEMGGDQKKRTRCQEPTQAGKSDNNKPKQYCGVLLSSVRGLEIRPYTNH